jgi:hypothetical protein
MDQEVSHRCLTAEVSVRDRVSPYGFMVEKMASGQGFLTDIGFYNVSIIPPWLSILMYHLRDKQ